MLRYASKTNIADSLAIADRHVTAILVPHEQVDGWTVAYFICYRPEDVPEGVESQPGLLDS